MVDEVQVCAPLSELFIWAQNNQMITDINVLFSFFVFVFRVHVLTLSATTGDDIFCSIHSTLPEEKEMHSLILNLLPGKAHSE